MKCSEVFQEISYPLLGYFKLWQRLTCKKDPAYSGKDLEDRHIVLDGI